MADLIIRGMEMPTEHRTEVLIFKNGFVAYYDVFGHYLGQAKATPLPAGHGRLIDADDLIDEMCLAWEYDEITNAEWTGIREWLNHSPTIVPAEGGKDNG